MSSFHEIFFNAQLRWHRVEITEIHSYIHFDKNFVKATFCLRKLLHVQKLTLPQKVVVMENSEKKILFPIVFSRKNWHS